MKKLFIIFSFFIYIQGHSQNKAWKFESNRLAAVKDESSDSIISLKKRTITFDAERLSIYVSPDDITFNIVSDMEEKRDDKERSTLLRVKCIDSRKNNCTVVFAAIETTFYFMIVYYYDLGVKHFYSISNQIL